MSQTNTAPNHWPFVPGDKRPYFLNPEKPLTPLKYTGPWVYADRLPRKRRCGEEDSSPDTIASPIGSVPSSPIDSPNKIRVTQSLRYHENARRYRVTDALGDFAVGQMKWLASLVLQGVEPLWLGIEARHEKHYVDARQRLLRDGCGRKWSDDQKRQARRIRERPYEVVPPELRETVEGETVERERVERETLKRKTLEQERVLEETERVDEAAEEGDAEPKIIEEKKTRINKYAAYVEDVVDEEVEEEKTRVNQYAAHVEDEGFEEEKTRAKKRAAYGADVDTEEKAPQKSSGKRQKTHGPKRKMSESVGVQKLRARTRTPDRVRRRCHPYVETVP